MSWAFETDLIETWAYYEKLFTPEECKKIIELGNKREKKDANINNNNKINEKIRKNKVAWLNPQDDTNWIFLKLSYATNEINNKFFNFDLWGIAEPLQFTEYKAPDNHYDQHIDKLYNAHIRKLSIVIQLSDPLEYEGGDLNIIAGPKHEKMKKEQGNLIIFPSYVLHKVNPITKGTRYSLVAWVTGKPFK